MEAASPPRRALPVPEPKADRSKPDSLTFEQAVERLESIVERIEAGTLGLEESITQYEQGVALIARCKDILRTQEQRVEELNRRAAGLLGNDPEAAA